MLWQETGGSIGGGDWGGGGGGGYSGGGGGYSYSGGSDYSSGYGGGSGCGDMDAGAVLAIVVIFIVIALVKAMMRGLSSGPRYIGGHPYGPVYTPPSEPEMLVDVTSVQLGIDWRARQAVQDKLAILARAGQTTTAAGRANIVREASLLLRRCKLSWIYADVKNAYPDYADSAKAVFQQMVSDARGRFNTEVVRNADGIVTQDRLPALRARSEEGEGYVVVTFVVAARRQALPDVADARNAAAIENLLRVIGTLVEWQLVAFELIWSPAAENDRMSSLELESRYPELLKIDERTIAGRVICDYCSGPYPAELLKCPHCGAARAA